MPRPPTHQPLYRRMSARIGPAVPFVVRTTAIGGAGVALSLAGRKVIQAWGDRNDPPPLEQSVVEKNGVTYVRTPDGGLVANYDAAYLAKLKELGYNVGGLGGPGVVPAVLDEPLTAEQSAEGEQQKALLGALTDPVALLIVGAVIVGVFFVKGRK